MAHFLNYQQASIPVDELQIIHRYRPSHHDEHDRKYQGYSRHVGSILKSKEFVDYYDGKLNEGLLYNTIHHNTVADITRPNVRP